MPRIKGSGKLTGKRLTIRLDPELEQRLADRALGRQDAHGRANYSDIFRDALEHYLNCPLVSSRQDNGQADRVSTPLRETPEASALVITADRQAFYRAYMDVGHGRSFVAIHAIRQALGWTQERFDHMLDALRADYTLELHGGNPADMMPEQITDSYIDDRGRKYFSVTWRG